MRRTGKNRYVHIPIRQEATLAALITIRHAPTARQGVRLRNEVGAWTSSQ